MNPELSTGPWHVLLALRTKSLIFRSLRERRLQNAVGTIDSNAWSMLEPPKRRLTILVNGPLLGEIGKHVEDMGARHGRTDVADFGENLRHDADEMVPRSAKTTPAASVWSALSVSGDVFHAGGIRTDKIARVDAVLRAKSNYIDHIVVDDRRLRPLSLDQWSAACVYQSIVGAEDESFAKIKNDLGLWLGNYGETILSD